MFLLLPLSAKAKSLASDDDRVLRIAFATNIVTLNPMKQLDLISASVLSNIYDSLFYSQGIAKPTEPMLIDSYERLDNNIWRFSLRKKILFHNGKKLNAYDIKASLDYQRDNKRSKWANHLAFIEKIVIVNEYKFDIFTSGQIDNLPEVLRIGYNYIMPSSHCKSGSDNLSEQNPIGTGPYQLANKSADKILLKRNPNYWGPQPFFDYIEYYYIPDDSKRLKMLQEGKIDIETQFNTYKNIYQIDNPTFKVEKAMSSRVVFMEIVNGIKNRKSDGIFKNVLFRRALNLSINRDEIFTYVLFGNGIPLTSFVSPVFPAYDASLGYRYDLNQAKLLLEQSGYDSSEIIEIISPSGRYSKDYQVAKAVVSYYKAIGVNAKLELYNNWAEYQNVLHGNTDKQTFIALIGFGVINFQTLLEFYFGREWERNRFADPELKNKIQGLNYLAAQKKLDQEKKVAERVHKQSYIIPLYNVMNVYGVNKSLDIHIRNDDLVNIYIVKHWNNKAINKYSFAGK